MPTSQPAACCRCARTPAPPSSWARRARRCGPAVATSRRSPRASTRPIPRPICATARSRRSRCSRKCRPAPTCRRRSTSTRPTAMPTSSCSSPRAAALLKFLDTQIRTLGTAACPPYHLAIVVGGTSAEMNLKTVKLASTRYLDDLPDEGNDKGVAIRDREMEKKVLELTRQMGIGAQFGGKYFCHDVRVIRIARHGASVPIGLGVSCSADRQALGKITKDGIYLEQLETNPAHYLPEVEPQQLSGDVVSVDLDKGMAHTLAVLTRHPVKTRVNLTGTLIVARDSAHAKLKERLDAGQGLPDYFKQFPVYYAGPAKTPQGMASGSFGPTTAGRMDSYVDLFQANGGSMVMLAKGNRSKQVVDACKKHKGFYLGSIGGPAAILAKNCIRKVEVLEYPELGMEAIWRIQVENFPAFIVTDDKGNDFFSELKI